MMEPVSALASSIDRLAEPLAGSLLAHQSDWVAMALVFIPLGAFAAILAVADKRADRDGRVDMTPPPPRRGAGSGTGAL